MWFQLFFYVLFCFVRCLNFDISQGQLGKVSEIYFLNGDLPQSLQASTARVCHEDTRALLKAEGLLASLQGGAVVLLTIHIEPNLLMLDRQRKAVHCCVISSTLKEATSIVSASPGSL